MPDGLAYIGLVHAIEPIPNADRIELATVVCGEGGKWQGVVKKGDYQVNSKCVAILQDSVVPADEEYKFLAGSNYRVKMARFRGAPSECVIMPSIDGAAPIGLDVTEQLGIVKYVKELPLSLNGVAIGNFPSFIPKTDEPNYQTAYRLLEALRGKPWVATVKCDGSSVTAYRHEGRFGVCSRNLELVESGCGPWFVARKYNMDVMIPDNFAVQFELVGPGIQKNPMGLANLESRAFNVYDIELQSYVAHDEAHRMLKSWGIPAVKVTDLGDSFDLDSERLRHLATGTYEGTDKQREGVVIRPFVEEWVGQSRLSFKVINLLYKD